jgi:hypothetical protein
MQATAEGHKDQHDFLDIGAQSKMSNGRSASTLCLGEAARKCQLG